jgi:hypothetical protein
LTVGGWHLEERAQYTEAEPLYRRALAIYEKVLVESPNTGVKEEIRPAPVAGKRRHWILHHPRGFRLFADTAACLDHLKGFGEAVHALS